MKPQLDSAPGEDEKPEPPVDDVEKKPEPTKEPEKEPEKEPSKGSDGDAGSVPPAEPVPDAHYAVQNTWQKVGLFVIVLLVLAWYFKSRPSSGRPISEKNYV